MKLFAGKLLLVAAGTILYNLGIEPAGIFCLCCAASLEVKS